MIRSEKFIAHNACLQVKNGYIQGVMDEETQSSAIELHGINTR